MQIQTIGILGGTGFVGSHLVNRLTKDGYQLRVLTRSRERHRDLWVLPTVTLIEADVHDPAELKQHLAGCDAVINLVGILNESGNDGSGFRYVHVDLPRKIVDVCRENRIKRLLHMSALNADAERGPSFYLRTKGEAEDLVHTAASDDLKVTSFRPSVIFGPDDDFFNRFAKLLKLTPIFFPLACPKARFAPVYIGDVTEAFVRTISAPASYSKRYDLCGPREYTLKELVEYTAKTLRLHRIVIPLGDRLSRIQARTLEFVPGKPFSRDNYLSMQVDSLCRRSDLDVLGITPLALEAVVPEYLTGRSKQVRFQRFRSQARRS
ncbi:MAG: complex I NDUFA9 subunit family protein [Gammaproteobacteria bacterium]|nr:complex I NDUFA9 subunit family protein [Gammaproteobacteria bacterium]